MRKLVMLALKTLLFGIAGCLVLLAIFQSKLIYMPRPYQKGEVARWASREGCRVIDYQTGDGPQQAFLMTPTPDPKHLWLVCGGNGSVSLDWADWMGAHVPQGDGVLLVDMPGYGACSGSPNPNSIRRSMAAVVPAAEEALHWNPADSKGRLRFFGQSLGCAVCLIAARENDIREGVLLAPFTSTMEMARVVTGMPLGFLVWQRLDNLARLREIESLGGGRVVIVHGTSDEIIPVAMSRALAAAAPKTVRYVEVPGGRHNNLPEFCCGDIEQAMFSLSEPK